MRSSTKQNIFMRTQSLALWKFHTTPWEFLSLRYITSWRKINRFVFLALRILYLLSSHPQRMFVLEGGLYGRPSIQQYAHCPANEGNIPPEGLRLKGRLITHCSIALALAFQIDLYFICISNFISTVLASALNLTPPTRRSNPYNYPYTYNTLVLHPSTDFFVYSYLCFFL